MGRPVLTGDFVKIGVRDELGPPPPITGRNTAAGGGESATGENSPESVVDSEQRFNDEMWEVMEGWTATWRVVPSAIVIQQRSS